MIHDDNSVETFLLVVIQADMSDQTTGDIRELPDDHDSLSEVERQQKINLKQYFDEKLHPKLSAALNACAIARPDDPVEFVGNFLLAHPERRV